MDIIRLRTFFQIKFIFTLLHGILKSTTTGELLGFAPYFDHNLSFNAHLGYAAPIGMGQYSLCEQVVGEEKIRATLQNITMDEIIEIDYRVRQALETDISFEWVKMYFQNMFSMR